MDLIIGAAAETTAAKRLPLIAQAAEHVLQQKDGKPRYLLAVTELSKAFALAVPNDEALEIRDEVGFFQEVRAVLAKSISEGGGKSPEELDLAVRQIVSRAISSDKVIDIFDAAGLKKPDISILSDEFLAEVQHLPQRNLAVELLQKLLNNELKIRSEEISRPIPLLRRNAGSHHPQIPKPHHRSRAGHRGID